MTTDLREHAIRLLQHEHTRSLSMRRLRERLQPAAGPSLPSCAALEQDFARDARFRLLRVYGGGVAARFASAVEAAGVGPEVHVVLTDAGAAQPEEPLGGTRGSLLAALERDEALAGEIAAALGELEELTTLLERRPDAGTAPSTTPPPGLPARPRSQRRWRPPASAPPPSVGSRSGPDAPLA